MMGYRKKYTVEYLDAGRVTQSWQSLTPPSVEAMRREYIFTGDDARYVMRWFSAARRFRVFRLDTMTVTTGTPASIWQVSWSNTSVYSLGPGGMKLAGKASEAPVFEHEDRDACIMWTAMRGDDR